MGRERRREIRAALTENLEEHAEAAAGAVHARSTMAIAIRRWLGFAALQPASMRLTWRTLLWPISPRRRFAAKKCSREGA